MPKDHVKAPASDTRLPPGLRRYLYFTAAVTGMAVMIVEILGAKMLAPYVGTSHFVWTAQIAVTLVALATGYYTGGKFVDRMPRLGRLYAAILAAAIYLCASVLMVEPVAFWCLDFRLALGSLLASAMLFFVPLALLAMVGPFFVRVLTCTVANVGGNVGRLTAIGTLGSFCGTILIGYVLIPFLPNSTIMCLSAGALMLVAAGYFFSWGRKRTHAAPVILVMAAGVLLGLLGVNDEIKPRYAGAVTQFRANSNFGEMLVFDLDRPAARYRVYLNDLLTQNIYDVRTGQSTTMYTYLLHGLARAYTTNIADALCIGLGAGIVPRALLRDGAKVDVVEINRAIVPVAKKLFDCPVEKLNLTIGDGRQFLNKCRKQYDVIILDVFLGDSSPSHLMTRESFKAMRRVLRPGGVLVINVFADLRPGHDFFAASLHKTLKNVFRSVRIHTAGTGNMLFVASDQPELRFINQPDLAEVHPACRNIAEQAFAGTPEPDPQHGIVLTDNYNPVEFYDAANREQFRRLATQAIQR